MTGHLAIAELAALAAARPPSAHRTRVVAIDGPSGSGKSTLAARLAAAAGPGVPVIAMDDLYPGWDGLAEAVPRLLEWVLQPLAAGQAARYRRYDWAAGRYAEWHPVPPAPLLVVEGVASGSRAAAPHLAMLLWVEAPQPVRFRRGIERDGEAYLPHWQRWARQEQAHFAAEDTRARAELRICGAPTGPVDPEAAQLID